MEQVFDDEIVKVKHNVRIVLSNGDQYSLSEDIEGFLEIRKEYSDTTENINVKPRYANVITIN